MGRMRRRGRRGRGKGGGGGGHEPASAGFVSADDTFLTVLAPKEDAGRGVSPLSSLVPRSSEICL